MKASASFQEYIDFFDEEYYQLFAADLSNEQLKENSRTVEVLTRPFKKLFKILKNAKFDIMKNPQKFTPAMNLNEVKELTEYLNDDDRLIQMNLMEDVTKHRTNFKDRESENTPPRLFFQKIPNIPHISSAIENLVRKHYPDVGIQISDLIKQNIPPSCCKESEEDFRERRRMKKPKPACEICESHSYFISGQSIIDLRNLDEHLARGEKNLEDLFERYYGNYHRNKAIIPQIPKELIFKIIATIIHVGGLNNWIWTEPPKTLNEIWTDFPHDKRNDLKKTLESLRQNTPFAQENYVDRQGRKTRLIEELKGSKVVTIHGEGGLGKTELVYQSLENLVETGIFEFDYFLPFTFKNDEQGETSPSSNELKSANQSGWMPSSEFTQILDVLSNLLHEKSTNNMDERLIRAADFFVNQDVCLIIDNHETVEANESQQLDVLLDKIVQHENYSRTNSKIIITTRVRPPDKRIGAKVPIDYLNAEEMGELARKRAIWVAKTSSEKQIRYHLDTDTDWAHVINYMKGEMGQDKLRRQIGGHPIVVFIAVHNTMIENEEGQHFNFIIQKLMDEALKDPGIEGGKLNALMKYITGRSFNYIADIDNCYHLLHTLTELHSFSTEEYEQVVTDHGYPKFTELIDNLEKLELIGKTQDTYSFRSKYHSKDLQEYLEDKFEDIGKTDSWFSKWWEGNFVHLSKRPMVPMQLQYLTIENQTAKDELEKMKKGDFKGSEVIKICNLLQRLLRLLEDLRNPELKRTILHKDETLGYEHSLKEFTKSSILSIVEGLTCYFTERPLTEVQFNQLITILDKNNEIIFSSGQNLELTNSLLNQICENLPGYSRNSAAPLHTLWRVVNNQNLNSLIVAKVGMTLFTKAGDALDKEIISTIFDLDLESIAGHIGVFSSTIKPIGKFLTEKLEHLSREECRIFLDNLSMHSKEGIYSSEEIEVESFKTIAGKVVGSVRNESKQLYFCNHFDVPDEPVLLRIQSLYESKDDDYEPIVYCLFREVSGHIKKDIPQSIDAQDVIKQKNAMELSQDEMWGFLQRIQFHEVSAAQLFGEYLLDELKKGNIDISGGKIWKRWRQKHFANLSGIEAIKKISDGKWVPLQLNSGNDITVRKVSNTSTDIERTKERIQVLLQQRKVRRSNLRITSPDSKRSNRMERRANLNKVRVSIQGRNRKTAKKLPSSFKPKTEEE